MRRLLLDRLRADVEESLNRRNESLRSYAQKLGVSPGALSQILSEKRSFGLRTQKKVAVYLGISHKAYSAATNPAEVNEEAPRELSEEVSIATSHWIYYALMELAQIESLNHKTNQFVAKRLGVSTQQVDLAWRRLSRLGLIQKHPQTGFYTKAVPSWTTHQSTYDSLLAQALQRQYLNKSAEALTHVNREIRDHSALVFAFDHAQIGQLRHEIDLFRERVEQIAMRSKNPTEVYLLQVGLLPLSKTVDPKEEKRN